MNPLTPEELEQVKLIYPNSYEKLKRITGFLTSGDTNRCWEAYLAYSKSSIPWNYSTSLDDVKAYFKMTKNIRSKIKTD